MTNKIEIVPLQDEGEIVKRDESRSVGNTVNSVHGATIIRHTILFVEYKKY